MENLKRIQDELTKWSVGIQTSEKQFLLTVMALSVFLSLPVFAQTTDPWGSFLTLITDWIVGNLGKFIALVGMFISVIIFLFTHNTRILAYGIVGSVLIGGLVGFTRMFFNAGGAALGNNW